MKKPIKKLGFGVLLAGGVMWYGCAAQPQSGKEVVREVTTNTVIVYVTNSPQNQPDTNMMQMVIGDWLVYEETYLTITNGSGGEPIECVLTNTYDSPTNGGKDGAYSYRFKVDGNVDRVVYNSVGGVMKVYTNVFGYLVVSNSYGYRIDLELLEYQCVSVYYLPDGPMEMLFDPIEEIIVKTNYIANYRITNVVVETNTTYFVVTNTNGWKKYVDRTRYFVSYVWELDGDRQYWTPDTNTYQVIVNGGVRSMSSVVESLVIVMNATNVNTTALQNFVLLPWDTKKLRRLP